MKLVKYTLVLTIAIIANAKSQSIVVSNNPDLLYSTGNNYGLYGAPEGLFSFNNDYGILGSPEMLYSVSNDFGLGVKVDVIQPRFELIEVPLEVP